MQVIAKFKENRWHFVNTIFQAREVEEVLNKVDYPGQWLEEQPKFVFIIHHPDEVKALHNEVHIMEEEDAAVLRAETYIKDFGPLGDLGIFYPKVIGYIFYARILYAGTNTYVTVQKVEVE